MRRVPLVAALALVASLFLLSGCVLGSPLAAFSGEPYGMVIDDVKALQGRNGRIWSKAPFFAVIDIPFAAVLDTAFLPISCIMWLILPSDHEDSDHDED